MTHRAKNNIRVTNEDQVVHNAAVEIRTGVDEDGNDIWVDIRESVNSISWTPKVGDFSKVTLGLICATMKIKGAIDEETYQAFAASLRLRGWEVTAPQEQAA